MTMFSTTTARTSIAATAMLLALCGGAATASACDINSATDISCGPISVNPANPLSPLNISNPANPSSPLNINNPANPSSPLNAANQQANSFHRDPATDPNSPYFSEPTYADGIFGLFETNPRIVYPAGPVQTCRLGLDCPQDVARSSGATLYGLRPVAQAAPSYPAYPDTPVRHRRHRHSRAAR